MLPTGSATGLEVDCLALDMEACAIQIRSRSFKQWRALRDARDSTCPQHRMLLATDRPANGLLLPPLLPVSNHMGKTRPPDRSRRPKTTTMFHVKPLHRRSIETDDPMPYHAQGEQRLPALVEPIPRPSHDARGTGATPPSVNALLPTWDQDHPPVTDSADVIVYTDGQPSRPARAIGHCFRRPLQARPASSHCTPRSTDVLHRVRTGTYSRRSPRPDASPVTHLCSLASDRRKTQRHTSEDPR